VKAQQNIEPPLALYELWRPIIRPRRRFTLERIHQNIAEHWSGALRDFLGRGEQVEFAGLEFESFQKLSEREAHDCQTAAFAIEDTEIVGFLLLSDVEARKLVDNRLGLGRTEPVQGERIKFSRIEGAILREAIHLILDRLSSAYALVGLGRLVVTRQSERLADTLVFSPQDYLVILRYRVGAAPNSVAITLAISSNMINGVRDMAGGDRSGGGSKRLRAAAAELPMQVDVVLGSWAVPPQELAVMKAGDKIILPDGEDAWLEGRGVRLRKVRARFDGPESLIEVKSERYPSSIPARQRGARIVVEAVLARLNVPAGAFTSFESGDEIDVEPEIGFAPMVRLVTRGKTIATASIAQEDDRLMATILQLGPEPTGRRDDRWLYRKKADLTLQ
jgi:flagellar motor switch protein FliM